MWLISNPLFEIGAGLVLIAATVWMLLNATAPRPAAPVPAATPLPPAPPRPAEPALTLGPLSASAPRAMYLADEEAVARAEPPLRLAPESLPPPPAPPPLEARLPDIAPPVAESSPPAAEPVAPPVEAVPAEREPEAPTPLGAPEVEPVAEAVASDPSGQPADLEAGAELQPAASEPEPVLPTDAVEPAPAPPAEPIPVETLVEDPAEPAVDPAPSKPFEVLYPAWLEGLLQAAPGAPSSGMVIAGARRLKPGPDPAWPEAARDLRAAIESLGKLAPAVFATPGARERTEALAAAAGAPLALIWPEIGAAFDPLRQEARSGDGDAVAAVIRPGLAYGGSTALPALVVRGSPPSSPSG